jgi:hypothetical protein
MWASTGRAVDLGGVDLEPAPRRVVAAHEGGAAHIGDALDRLARARRWAISTMARSALPYSSRSALLSTTMERRTLSLQ